MYMNAPSKDTQKIKNLTLIKTFECFSFCFHRNYDPLKDCRFDVPAVLHADRSPQSRPCLKNNEATKRAGSQSQDIGREHGRGRKVQG